MDGGDCNIPIAFLKKAWGQLTHYDETKIWAHDQQIVRAKENLKLGYSSPSQGQASGTKQWIKALCQISMLYPTLL